MALYAILDAAKITNLPELLATSGLEHRCLFKGQAEDDLKNVAPWIVKLEDGNSFTRHLFTHDPANDVPWYLWDKDPGIYIRSTATLDDLWKHFRKFTRLQDENGKWFYLRFWDSGSIVHYFAEMRQDTPRAARWLIAYGHPLHILTQNTAIRPAPHLIASKASGALRIGTFEQRAFQRQTHSELITNLARDLRQMLPAQTAALDETALQDRTARIVTRLQGYGLTKGSYLFQLATLDLSYGEAYETKEATGQLQAILTADTPQDEKFNTYIHILKNAQVA